MSKARLRAGLRKFYDKDAVDVDSMNAVGSAPLQVLFDAVLAGMFGSTAINADAFDAPQSRFLGSSFFPSYTSGLGLTVLSGLMLYDRVAKAAAVVADEVYTPTYIPVMSPTNTVVTLDAHHATLPRYDVIWARPATVEDDSQNLRYRPAGRGSMAVRTLNRRAKYGVEIGTTKGTAHASPSVPTIPTNAVAIAVCLVPATSGNLTVTDVRQQLQLGSNLPVIPNQSLAGANGHTTYARGVVLRAADGECEVTVSGTTLTATVAGGWVDIEGQRRNFAGGTATLTAGDATHPRYDIIYLRLTGDGLQLLVATGTPGASPALPTLAQDAIPLASHYMAPAATSITEALITDLRPRKPYTEDHVELDPAISAVPDWIPVVAPAVTIAASSSSKRRLTLQAKTQAGANYAGTVHYLLEAWEDSADAPEDISRNFAITSSNVTFIDAGGSAVGSFVVGASKPSAIYASNSSGNAVLDINISASGPRTFFLRVKAIRYVDATAGGSVSSTGNPAYIPGAEFISNVEVS